MVAFFFSGGGRWQLRWEKTVLERGYSGFIPFSPGVKCHTLHLDFILQKLIKQLSKAFLKFKAERKDVGCITLEIPKNELIG